MKANQNIEEEKWAALAKQLFDADHRYSRDTSQTEQQELPTGVHSRKELEELAFKLDLYFSQKNYHTGRAWEKVQGRLHKKQHLRPTLVRQLLSRPFLRVAATLLLVALLTVAGYEWFIYPGNQDRITAVNVAGSAVQQVTLSDGTLVSLNSNTTITYPRQFGNHTREVTIEGEAFFEVKPDPGKPFIIHAGTAQVKVLGTSFNVRAYPGAREMEVIVRTGKVQVLNLPAQSKQNDELILNPGDKGTLVHAGHVLMKSTNEDPNYISWKTHDLVFRATSLNEVILLLEDVYKVKIQLDDPELGGQLLTAHFNNYSLDFILKVIETTFRLETRQVDGKYILKTKS